MPPRQVAVFAGLARLDTVSKNLYSLVNENYQSGVRTTRLTKGGFPFFVFSDRSGVFLPSENTPGRFFVASTVNPSG